MRLNSIKRDTPYQSAECSRSSENANAIGRGTAWLLQVRVVRRLLVANGRNPSARVLAARALANCGCWWPTLNLHDLLDWAALVLHWAKYKEQAAQPLYELKVALSMDRLLQSKA